MEGYKFKTEQEAINALKQVNDKVNFPEGSVTTSWTSYNFAASNEPTFYYIPSDSFTDTILKGKQVFTLAPSSDGY